VSKEQINHVRDEFDVNAPQAKGENWRKSHKDDDPHALLLHCRIYSLKFGSLFDLLLCPASRHVSADEERNDRGNVCARL
jgi:hypothetical protein